MKGAKSVLTECSFMFLCDRRQRSHPVATWLLTNGKENSKSSMRRSWQRQKTVSPIEGLQRAGQHAEHHLRNLQASFKFHLQLRIKLAELIKSAIQLLFSALAMAYELQVLNTFI